MFINTWRDVVDKLCESMAITCAVRLVIVNVLEGGAFRYDRAISYAFQQATLCRYILQFISLILSQFSPTSGVG